MCLRVTHEVVVKTTARELERLLFIASCYPETPVSCDMNLSLGCLHVIMTWCLASSRASDSKESKVESTMSLMTYPWKSHVSNFYCILFIRIKSSLC